MDTPNRISDLYDMLLVDDKKVTIRFPSFREYETLRVALCKRNKLMTALDISDRSVIARWDEQGRQGTFSLGIPASREKKHSWEIVSISDATPGELQNDPEV
jgi:hypothetical protein